MNPLSLNRTLFEEYSSGDLLVFEDSGYYAVCLVISVSFDHIMVMSDNRCFSIDNQVMPWIKSCQKLIKGSA